MEMARPNYPMSGQRKERECVCGVIFIVVTYLTLKSLFRLLWLLLDISKLLLPLSLNSIRYFLIRFFHDFFFE